MLNHAQVPWKVSSTKSLEKAQTSNRCMIEMSSTEEKQHTTPSLPPSAPKQTHVTISPIAGGYITLPDSAFISPADPAAKRYVPSLAFLITHPGIPLQPPNPYITSTKKPLRILFDLGLRQKASDYLPLQQKHLATRAPYELSPSVPERLRQGGLKPEEDIDIVILSHVHYDHHGDPTSFPNAKFHLGPGSLHLLKNGLPPSLGSHQHFSQTLFPDGRASEFPSPEEKDGSWNPLGPFDHTIDLLNDGSVYVVNTPGHLPGHLNLLCRVGAEKWVCLCGDAFHDPRLLSGEKEIGMWEGEGGQSCCIHLDRAKAEESIRRLRELRKLGNVELIAAHDDSWAKENEGRFFPNAL
jgi:glyoxylase-like metal-dependent hydrolase (beta-lactamase superfamily II)